MMTSHGLRSCYMVKWWVYCNGMSKGYWNLEQVSLGEGPYPRIFCCGSYHSGIIQTAVFNGAGILDSLYSSLPKRHFKKCCPTRWFVGFLRFSLSANYSFFFGIWHALGDFLLASLFFVCRFLGTDVLLQSTGFFHILFSSNSLKKRN